MIFSYFLPENGSLAPQTILENHVEVASIQPGNMKKIVLKNYYYCRIPIGDLSDPPIEDLHA